MNKKTNKNAFTMIEMLAVIVILGVLLALVIGVTDYVRTEAKRKQTKSIMNIVMTAIQVYYDEEGEWPQIKTGSGSGDWDPADHYSNDTAPLMFVLKNQPKCKEMITKLSNDTWGKKGTSDEQGNDVYTLTFTYYDGSTAVSENAFPSLLCGYGYKMVYFEDGGLGDRPLLISAGKDGKFGNNLDDDNSGVDNDEREKRREDNIRSDDQ